MLVDFRVFGLSNMNYSRLFVVIFFVFLSSLFIGIHCAVGPESSNLNEPTPGSNCTCAWTEWMNNPDYSSHIGDNNTYSNLRRYYSFCDRPSNIECRNKRNPNTLFHFFENLGLDCNVTTGLLCVSRTHKDLRENETAYYCDDYEIRVRCCDCPQQSTSAPTSTVSITNLYENVVSSDTTSVIIQTTNPGIEVFGIPISLVIVIAVAVLLIIGISLCIVCTHKERKQHKVIRRNLRGDSYLQRPVSFTDVDLMKRSSLASSTGDLSEDAQHSGVHMTELDNAKLRFMDPEADDEPDLVTSTKSAHQEPLLAHTSSEKRWLPDEFARQLEVHVARNSLKKSAFSHSAPLPPPPPPAQKSVAFPDNDDN